MAVLMHRLSTHSRDVNYCSFSSCSKILASVSGDKTVRLWDVEKGTELDFSPLTGHTYQVSTCAFSPFGTILATGSQDCSVFLWNTSTGERLNVLSGHRGGIKCCTFSPNSNYLASASCDETLCIWDNSSKQLLRVLKGHESIVSTCRFSPDNLYILSGSSNGDLMLFEVQSGKCRAKAMAHDRGLSGVGVAGCDFSPTFGSADSFNKNPHSNGESPHFLAASCGGDNTVKLWDVFAASAYSDKCHMQVRFTFTGHQGQVWDCKFSTNGKMLASCSSDKAVIIWDPIQCTTLLTITGHTRYITTVAFAPNGMYLATGSNDKTVQVWKLNVDGTGLLAQPQAATEEKTTENGTKSPKKLMNTWDVNDVCTWLGDLGLSQYAEIFRTNDIDGIELSNVDNKVLGEDLGIAPLGHRNKILREVKRIRTEEHDGAVPDEFLCPITREIMSDPVIASDGFSYERAAITGWIESGKVTSPMTNAPLSNPTLTPNRSLKNAIMRSFSTAPSFASF
eukprot:Seg1718.3 transcript_id=Seg1718.3/GoldUCD/mRNA.D3Y31 product="WD repeat SAM and U-box domain-containing protein 1" protein_id=Seg1718.3/GoldUCD/D3Y31